MISTDPRAGTKIRDGADIEATLSKGPERYPVPTLVGAQETTAQQAILAAHLRLGAVSTSYSDSVAKGKVLSSSQPAGTELKPQTAIGLNVSAGPKPITITDYTGKSADDAEKALKKAGFSVKTSSQHSDSVPSGSVISQSPDDGTGTHGDTVSLVTSLGPVMVEVPNVRAMGVSAATSVMKKAGFGVKTAKVSANYLGLGYVSYTKPGIGGKARKGSTIVLYLV